MTPPAYVERARALDDQIQVIDRRIVLARVNDAPSHTLESLVAQRNALTRQWAATWGCRKVES